jgi:hypothetical protein
VHGHQRPGATNLVSAIADAFMDSIPLVAITGQVYSKYIGKMAFQETDFFGMTLPIVKHSYLVLNAHDLPRIFKEAFHLARSGRPGPVVIDIPKDVQQAKFQPVFPATVEFRNPYDQQRFPRRPMSTAAAGAGPDRRGETAGALRRRRHHFGRGARELKAFAEKTNMSRGHDPDGRRRVSRRATRCPCSGSACTAPPTATGRWTRATCCSASARASTTASPATSKIRGPREDRAHRHRRLGAQQEQARPPADHERHQVRPRPAQRARRRRQVHPARHSAWHEQIAAVEEGAPVLATRKQTHRPAGGGGRPSTN